MNNKTLYSLTALFLFWTGVCFWLGIEQGRQQVIDGNVECVAVYREALK
jgi:hypothetical protein